MAAQQLQAVAKSHPTSAWWFEWGHSWQKSFEGRRQHQQIEKLKNKLGTHRSTAWRLSKRPTSRYHCWDRITRSEISFSIMCSTRAANRPRHMSKWQGLLSRMCWTASTAWSWPMGRQAQARLIRYLGANLSEIWRTQRSHLNSKMGWSQEQSIRFLITSSKIQTKGSFESPSASWRSTWNK